MKRFDDVSEEIDESEPFEIVNGDIENIVDDDVIEGEEEQDLEKGSMRKLISFVGERIWGVWG